MNKWMNKMNKCLNINNNFEERWNKMIHNIPTIKWFTLVIIILIYRKNNKLL